MDSTRIVALDIGSGSEIFSSVAVSALHGYRQSARLARTRRFGERLPESKRVFSNPAFAEFVLAPPALVIPIEMASVAISPLEATRISDVPSNAKLFASTQRNDCFGFDPDRIAISAINAAVGVSSSSDSDVEV